MFKLLGILFIVKLLLKEAILCLHWTLTLKTAKHLCPNLQKPPLPSEIHGSAPEFEGKLTCALKNDFKQILTGWERAILF